jgi:dienelactone hydrolase
MKPPTIPMRLLPLLLLTLVSTHVPTINGADFNPQVALERAFQVPAEFKGDYGTYASMLRFNDGRPVRNPADWELRRKEIRERWDKLMGPWPALVEDHKLEIIETRRRENFVQKKIRFQWSPTERAEGYLLIPDGRGRRPAVVTVFYEPETGIGEGKEMRDFAYQLAKRGFVTLSLGTTRTTRNRTYANYWPNREGAKVQPLSMLGCVAANAWNLLADQPEVDPKRIGIVGHSYGGKWAMFASCLFDKFACAAWSDPGIVFDDSRPSVNYWEPWYLGYEPPPWRKRGMVTPTNPATGLYPRLREQGRDLHELHALMAPRPFLVSGGSEDPPRRWQALNRSIEVNRLLGFSNRVAMTNRPKHSPTRESNAVIYSFFEKYLTK